MEPMNFEIDLSGLNSFKDKLKKAIDIYPDKAQDTLEILGKSFKSRAIKITTTSVDTITGNLIRGYKLDPVEGRGINMKVNFRATAHHFHLIEKGHELVTKSGNVIGFVPGRQMIKQCREEYKDVIPEKLNEMTKEILRESGFND